MLCVTNRYRVNYVGYVHVIHLLSAEGRLQKFTCKCISMSFGTSVVLLSFSMSFGTSVGMSVSMSVGMSVRRSVSKSVNTSVSMSVGTSD